MPRYTIRDPRSNRTLTIEGDSPPTEQELQQIFASLPAPTPQAPPAPDTPVPVSPSWATFNEQPIDPGPPDARAEFGGFLKGVGKSFGRAAVEAGDLVHEVPGVSRMVDALYGLAGVPMDSGRLMDEALLQPELTPQTHPEEMGKLAGDIGQFFLPGGTGKTTLPRMIVNEGVRGGLFSNLQGADAEGSAIGAGMGSLGPVVGRVLERAPRALRKKALERTQQFLGGTKERYKAMGVKVAPGLLERNLGGWTGASREGMLATATARAQQAGKAVDAMLTASAGRPVPTTTILARLEHLKNAYRETRIVTPAELAANATLAKRAYQDATGNLVVDVILDARPIRQLSKLQRILQDLGDETTVDKIVAVRRAWDEVVDQAGGYAQRAKGAIGVPLKESAEAWAKREAANAIRAELAKTAPGLARINKEYSFWINLADVLKQTQQRTAPQSRNLGKSIMGAAGMGAGLASGGDVADKAEKAALYGAVGSALQSAFASPRWRLVSAKLRLALANAIASGDANRIATATGRVMNAMLQPLTPGTTVERE